MGSPGNTTQDSKDQLLFVISKITGETGKAAVQGATNAHDIYHRIYGIYMNLVTFVGAMKEYENLQQEGTVMEYVQSFREYTEYLNP